MKRAARCEQTDELRGFSMRFLAYQEAGEQGLAIKFGDGYLGLLRTHPAYPGDLETLLGAGGDTLARAYDVLAKGRPVDRQAVTTLPPLTHPPKIVCIGLNYADHSAESGFETPAYPAIFARYATSLIGDGVPIALPKVSDQLDYEGEIAAIIGKGGRYITRENALSHVAGYALFNDVSVRDYQFKSQQWTIGKTFDASGPFGPEFITADELPLGVKGLRLETRLNGVTVQSATTDDMIFDVAALVALLSEAMTLEPGDVIVTGTPAGVGVARKPPLWMKVGDVCEVEVEGFGVLRNVIAREVPYAGAAALETAAA
jgi:2-keto-4-pentenoate hydratase/2-oxohepta-3-ene-1,7-dioic acid hydratase in catechol pathway